MLGRLMLLYTDIKEVHFSGNLQIYLLWTAGILRKCLLKKKDPISFERITTFAGACNAKIYKNFPEDAFFQIFNFSKHSFCVIFKSTC